MALKFGAATSDRVDIGSGASLDTLDPWTYMAWVYPTTITSSRVCGFHKGTSATTRRRFRIDDSSGNLSVFWQRQGVDLSYVANTLPLTINTWHFIAATGNTGASAGNIVHIYKGTLTTLAAEVGYSTKTDGDSPPNDDGANNMAIGNSNNTTLAFQGSIACGIYIAGELTLAQIRQWQFNPRKLENARWFCHLGFVGTGAQPDWSGNFNAGTVTGATVAPHVPLQPKFGIVSGWRGNRSISGGAFNRDFASSVAHSTTFARALALGRPVSISVAHSVAIARALANKRSITSSISHVATLDHVLGAMRSITSTISHNASIARVVVLGRAIASTISHAALTERALANVDRKSVV